MSVNLDGTFLTNHYAQKAMREKGYGRIVNIASNVILAGTPNLAHYVASKGGVWAFTRALAREVGKYGITVNSVAPGLTETTGAPVLKLPGSEVGTNGWDSLTALRWLIVVIVTGAIDNSRHVVVHRLGRQDIHKWSPVCLIGVKSVRL